MNFLEKSTNSGKLVGTICRAPIKTHEAFNENFYELILDVKRLSNTSDRLPVTISEKLLTDMSDFQEGKTLAVSGEYRSTNKLIGDRSKLVLYFFAKNIMPNTENDIPNNELNFLKLVGFICKPPIFRETPFRREICDVLLAVNRPNNNKSDYIPCITWGRNAKYMSSLSVGTKIELDGRIQSRQYKKQLASGESEDRVAYEVSCSNFNVVDNQKNITAEIV